MRVLVYPHSMEIGGSQLNAIELAAAVQDLGHEVLVISEPGPLVPMVRDLGLEHQAIALRRRRPSGPVIGLLLDQIRRRRIDVVHGYEWPPAVEAFLGPVLRLRVPAVATVMSAAVAPFLPRRMPLVVGTELLRGQVRAEGYRDVTLIEPPVDLDANSPAFDPGDFRARHGLSPDQLLVVVCCRLVHELKLEGLLVACQAIGELARDGWPVQLAIVGDGVARAVLERCAAQVNTLADRTVVVLTGELPDPRPAYAAADVVLGMGGSALRAMAFGKPLVVQGERGFWRACRPGTVHEFLAGGWYGRGIGEHGVARLRSELEPLLTDADDRYRTGAFSRALVVERFGLRSAAVVQADIYRRVIERPPEIAVADLTRLAGLLAVYKLRRRVQRIRGQAPADDFNSLSVMSPAVSAVPGGRLERPAPRQ